MTGIVGAWLILGLFILILLAAIGLHLYDRWLWRQKYSGRQFHVEEFDDE